MKTYIKIGGQEYEARVRLRRVDPDHAGRKTATVTMTATVEEAKTLLSDSGEWQCIQKDDEGNAVKTEDCGDYELLLQVTDLLDGSIRAVLGTARTEEVLQILMGGEV